MPPPREHTLPTATKIFVDREAPQRVFEKVVFSIPHDPAKLLVFYGAGGQGKTALYEELWRKTDPNIEPSYAFLRRAKLDLDNRRTDDSDLLMVSIRNSFAEAGINLPVFDLALALAWEATRHEQTFPNLTRPWLKRSAKEITGATVDWLFSEQGAEFIGDAVNEIPGMGFLVKLIGRWAFEKAKLEYLRRSREHLMELYNDGELKKPYELADLMPRMLAYDLNFHLSKHATERFVLFIDGYERVFAGAGKRWHDNPFDNHIRSFIQHADGLLVVFFSRERLHWESDEDWRADLEDQQHLLGGLSEGDAEEFLRKIPIDVGAIRRAIVDGSREKLTSDSPIYPLMLELQVEQWRALIAKNVTPEPHHFNIHSPTFEARRQEIIARVLREQGPTMLATIERLSVARRFDHEAFAHVVKTFETGFPLDSFDRIADLSFVTKGSDGFLTIHNVVVQTIQDMLDQERRSTSIEALLNHFLARSTVNTPREITDAKVAALIEAAALRQAQGITGYVYWLESNSEQYFLAARWATMEQIWREALDLVETSFGPEHPDTATSLENLARLLQDQGNYVQAWKHLERALSIHEKIFGPQDERTAETLGKLAELLQEQGDFTGARQHLVRALAIHEKIFGPQDERTAEALDKLAELLEEQGDLQSARRYLQRALAIREKVLGPDHEKYLRTFGRCCDLEDPDFSRGMDVSHLFSSIMEAHAQEPQSETEWLTSGGAILATAEQVVGSEHPSFGALLNFIGYIFQRQGDLAGARQHFERALAIREKVLGPEHYKTAESLNDLGALLHQQGDLAGARQRLERALAIREKVLGPWNGYTAKSLSNLASLLKEQGDLEAAQLLQERADAILEPAILEPWKPKRKPKRKSKRKPKRTSKGHRKRKSW
jgi:tetratricopeptide (TPR) repeat protein